MIGWTSSNYHLINWSIETTFNPPLQCGMQANRQHNVTEKIDKNSDNSFPCLDMEFFWNGNNLNTWVHIKPSWCLFYLGQCSNHPKTFFKAIPKGFFKRLPKLRTKTSAILFHFICLQIVDVDLGQVMALSLNRKESVVWWLFSEVFWSVDFPEFFLDIIDSFLVLWNHAIAA